MITRIREVRRAHGMTLLDVAQRCDPPTTAQTIGRLETGTRTVSIGWLNRIAGALGVSAGELVGNADTPADAQVAAVVDAQGARAPKRPRAAPVIAPSPQDVAVTVDAAVGDYRRGDVVWCRRVAPDEFAGALNRDVLLPRAAGRFIFGRLIARDGDKLLVLPPQPGARQQVVDKPGWAAIATRLVRTL
jgi:transcriptional regulator with XRE-family HTH domain